MVEYTLVDPATGKQWNLPAAELTENLRMNCILFRGDEHLGIITHRDLVAFARWCAGETLTRANESPDHRVTKALALVDRWLEDEICLSNEELKAAADAAEAAARAAQDAARAAGAAWTAARAAEAAAWTAARAAEAAAGAAWAATGAAKAADAAVRAAWAADAAVRAAWVAGAAVRAASYEVQTQWFVEHLQSGK